MSTHALLLAASVLVGPAYAQYPAPAQMPPDRLIEARPLPPLQSPPAPEAPIEARPLSSPGSFAAPAAEPSASTPPAAGSPATLTVAPAGPPAPTPEPGPAAPAPAPPQWVPRAAAELQVLDKLEATRTDRVIAAGQALEVGALNISVRQCVVRPPDMAPDAAAYVVVTSSQASEVGFEGWLLRDEPWLDMMQSALFDIRVLGCH